MSSTQMVESLRKYFETILDKCLKNCFLLTSFRTFIEHLIFFILKLLSSTDKLNVIVAIVNFIFSNQLASTFQLEKLSLSTSKRTRSIQIT